LRAVAPLRAASSPLSIGASHGSQSRNAPFIGL
jgi:hypothetical protein